MKFIHFKNWNPGNTLTWVPVDRKGKPIPHVYGHMATEDVGAKLLLPNWQKYDIYQVVEKVSRHFDLIGGGLVATPTGFKPWDGNPTAWYQENEYCDMGCLDCEYAYTHIDLETRPISGVFAVQKGAKVFGLQKGSAGESYFPLHFKLTAGAPA